MIEQTSGFGPLRAWVFLVLCLWHRAQPALGTPCQGGELRIISKDVEKCCPKCILTADGNKVCQEIEDHDCKCAQGYRCADVSCLYCTKLPECAEGEEVARTGTIDFTYKCKACGTGTYSSVKNGWCRNWTDCESSGFITIKQGNSTHNSQCGLPPAKGLEKAPIPSDSLYTTILAILTAVAVFVLILLTFLLHFCIWTLKDKYFTADDLEHHFPRPPAPPQLPLQGEESYSIQFPEEEHGDKAAEEKLSMLSLKVYNEIR